MERFIYSSVIALCVCQRVSFIYQIIHFPLAVQTTDISRFPFITTLHYSNFGAVISCCIFLSQAILLHPKPTEPNHIQKQFTMTLSGTSHSISHLEPLLFPTQWIHPIPFKYHSDSSYRRGVKPRINPATYGWLGNCSLSSRLVWSVINQSVCWSLTLTVMFVLSRKHAWLKTYKWLGRQQMIISPSFSLFVLLSQLTVKYIKEQKNVEGSTFVSLGTAHVQV